MVHFFRKLLLEFTREKSYGLNCGSCGFPGVLLTKTAVRPLRVNKFTLGSSLIWMTHQTRFLEHLCMKVHETIMWHQLVIQNPIVDPFFAVMLELI